MAGAQPAAGKAATPALVTITVAPRRTIQLPGKDELGEPATVSYGPGETVEVDAKEAARLRALGFAEPEKPVGQEGDEPVTVIAPGA